MQFEALETGEPKQTVRMLRPPRLPIWICYTSAPVAVGIAAGLRLVALQEPNVAQFQFFFPFVALVAWIGGWWPGALTALLSTLAGLIFFVRPLPPETSALMTTVAFVVSASLLALLCGWFRAAFLDAHRISEQRTVIREELRARDSTLQQAGHMAHLGAWHIDIKYPTRLEANPLVWSDEVFRIFGYAPGQVTVTSVLFYERVHPDDRPRVAQAMNESVVTGRPYSIEHRIVRPDGTERFVQEHADLVFDDEGVLRRIIGAVQDVTERKLAEEALRRANEQLKEADRRKNDFLAVLSHELRNPLAPIRNSLHVLEHTAHDEERASRARAVIDRQVGQMTRLIDDLLDINRISRGRIQLRHERIELGELVRRTVRDHRGELDAAGIELVLESDAGELWVDGDGARLTQILGNLLTNTAKFTAPGGRAVVSVTCDAAARQAVVRVADTGIGIAPEMVSRIFQPFTQADSSLDRSKGGLGLGLALVKSIIELHGGTVAGESPGLGRGATFTVRLPLETALKAPKAPAPAAVASPRRRVLVIDDNVDSADTLREALELDGHEVQVAYNGTQGLERAREGRPEVVLCDIGLPGMDGYEVARRLRADAALGSAFLIALTGYALPEDLERARAAGFDLHIAKPPSLERIEEAIATAPARDALARVLSHTGS